MAKNQIIIKWSPTAVEDLQNIRENIIDKYSTHRANEYIAGIYEKVDVLLKHPEGYPPCRSQTLRALNFRCILFKKRYVIVYDFVGTEIHIVGIYYARFSEERIKDLFA